MKLIKNMFLILTLVAINSVSAKKRGGAVAPKPATGTTTSASVTMPTKSFQASLQEVRSWKPSSGVINAQGEFTDKFISFVKNSGLESEQMETLMQAGRNLHMPLSGDMLKDEKLIIDSNKNIDNFMAKSTPRLEPIALKPLEPIALKPLENGDLQVSDIEEFLYYDQDNAMLKQDYLEQRIKDLLFGGKSGKTIISTLEPELNQKMRRSWADHNIQSLGTRTKELNQQIRETVNRLEKESQPLPKQRLPQPKPLQAPVTMFVGLDQEAEFYIKDLTQKNPEEVLEALFTGTKASGRYRFQNKGQESAEIINNMILHLENEYPNISKDIIASAITNGIRAGLNVPLTQDATQLKQFVLQRLAQPH